ncbi:MAG TPA: ACT domain-containing protein [Propionibacteriaceae bacterium]|nr:ACT domain-containing protein [Propionibacteriaceae bacterium]
MARLILTIVGADRAGLVATLADVISAHGGNWEDSRLAELDGTFAGVVVVAVPEVSVDGFTAALGDLDGLMTVTAHPGVEAPEVSEALHELTLTVLGNDRPGIVREVSAALSRHGVSIDQMTTDTRDAPMSGGSLFEAEVVARVPPQADLAALRADLERLATEIQVDISVDDEPVS